MAATPLRVSGLASHGRRRVNNNPHGACPPCDRARPEMEDQLIGTETSRWGIGQVRGEMHERVLQLRPGVTRLWNGAVKLHRNVMELRCRALGWMTRGLQ